MGYLAYDPARVAILAGVMRGARDQLTPLRCDDPLAADAVARVRHAQLHLDQLWLPLVDRLNSADPLGSARPAQLSDDGITDQLMKMMRDTYGWQIGDDGSLLPVPTGAPPGAPPTPEQAEALAQTLEDGDLGVYTDTDEERSWLAAELSLIGSNPALAAVFAGVFTRWGELADTLGHDRIGIVSDGDDPRPVDGVLLALATTYASAHGSGSIPELTREMEPYAAAAMISQLALDPQMLAWLSVELLRRLEDHRPRLWWEDQRSGPKTADLLFTAILATPRAATAFVVDVWPEPQLLWWTASDPTLAQQVAAVGTDPANIDPVSAHVVLHAFIDWFAHYRPPALSELRYTADPQRSRGFLGALVAPWFVEFGPSPDPWGPDFDARWADLGFVISDADAREELGRRWTDLLAAPDGATPRHTDREALAEAIGMFVELEVAREIRAARDAKASWDLGWSLATKLVTYGSKLLGPEAAEVGSAASKALTAVKQLADANGWLGAPPPPGDVAEQAAAVADRVILTATAVVLRIGYDALQADGRLAGVPPPPVPTPGHPDDLRAFWDDYDLWKEVYHVDGEAELELDAQLHLFYSNRDRARPPG